MKKKNVLPKSFLKMLQELKTLELQIERIETKIDTKDVRESRNKLMEVIWENWPRKTLLSKDILQMRGNALKNSEVKIVLNKYHMRIEDCALVNFGGEDHQGSRREWECPAHSSSESILKQFQEWSWGNEWKAHLDYYWGGPKDQVKILFRESNNNRFKIIGLIEMFPEKKAA
jgi:hypothetical protein